MKRTHYVTLTASVLINLEIEADSEEDAASLGKMLAWEFITDMNRLVDGGLPVWADPDTVQVVTVEEA